MTGRPKRPVQEQRRVRRTAYGYEASCPACGIGFRFKVSDVEKTHDCPGCRTRFMLCPPTTPTEDRQP